MPKPTYRSLANATPKRANKRKSAALTAPADLTKKSTRTNGEVLTKSARTRRQVLDAAAATLRKHGYSRTRLSDIVESVGIHPASIYYHFHSKDEMVREVLEMAVSLSMTFVRRAVEALPSSARPIDRMVTAIHAHMSIILELSDYVAASIRVLGEVPPEAYHSFVSDLKAYQRYWDELLLHAHEAGELRPTLNLRVQRVLLLAAMAGQTELYVGRENLSAASVADEVVRSFVTGICNPKLHRHLASDALRRMVDDVVKGALSHLEG